MPTTAKKRLSPSLVQSSTRSRDRRTNSRPSTRSTAAADTEASPPYRYPAICKQEQHAIARRRNHHQPTHYGSPPTHAEERFFWKDSHLFTSSIGIRYVH
mmetsp:Transcript_46037/g.68557  ORF Transcript_46037/g.68557 Transcript_46037/m.68557 type:complete len:100 (-) Transcript_46037:214-513(-)